MNPKSYNPRKMISNIEVEKQDNEEEQLEENKQELLEDEDYVEVDGFSCSFC